MTSLKDVLSLDDFEIAAQRHLPPPVFAYVHGGVEDNLSRADNRAAFAEYRFVPRVLVDVSRRTAETRLFDRTYAAPFGIAPIGMSALYAYRGDIVLARAAREANIPMALSGSSLIRMEDVHAQAPDTWFQAYLPGTWEQIAALIERVRRTGFHTLVVTVDCAVGANRENNVRAGFSAPLKPSLRLAWDGITHPRWLFGSFLKTLATYGMPHFENNFATRGAPILSANVLRDFSDRANIDWSHLRRIRAQWKGRLIIKGLLAREDAVIARDLGMDGVIVSNHGGRQLDGTVAPLRVLPEIVDACRDIPVMMDSGIRRGTDVMKALALGASFVFLGRPFGYAASVGGDAGVQHAISILKTEILRDLAMLGVNSVSELGPHHLRRVGPH